MIAETGERLQKVLARAGYGSRRVCDELITAGKVTVNGERADPGRRVDVGVDRVAVNGAPVGVLPGLVSYVLNKPVGVISSAHDEHGRKTVVDLVPGTPRVFPVGRLDFDSEGLIVLTNDGELAQLLAHPSHGVEKEYVAEVRGEVSPQALRQLREGVEIEPGFVTAPAQVSRRGPGVLRIVIHEGHNRQVRKMCQAVGLPVLRLVRTRIGPLRDTHLAPGAYRPLTRSEVRALAEAATGRVGTSRRERRGK